MGSALGPNRLAKYLAAMPSTPANKVAKPLFIPSDKVAPNKRERITFISYGSILNLYE